MVEECRERRVEAGEMDTPRILAEGTTGISRRVFPSATRTPLASQPRIGSIHGGLLVARVVPYWSSGAASDLPASPGRARRRRLNTMQTTPAAANARCRTHDRSSDIILILIF